MHGFDPTACLVRPFAFTAADYAALVHIDTAAWPGEPVSSEGMQHDDAMWDPAYRHERCLVSLTGEHDGQPVAYFQFSETPWAYEPDKYFIKIMVLPAFQGRGIGSYAYRRIVEALPGARLLTATTRADQPAAVRFLEQRGFRCVIREMESRLDVAAFQRSRFEPVLAQVERSGIAIYTMHQLQAMDADWLRKWYTLRWQVIPDMPTSEAFTQETLAEFAQWLTSPQLDLDAVFVAIERATGTWVGLSSVSVYPEDPETLYVGNTGVLRSHRRRGIALALKVHTIDFARARGAAVIIGENEADNPMLLLNEKLGFRTTHAWLGYEKPMYDADQAP
jgi:GNAT superfamily N-acetyltransferase